MKNPTLLPPLRPVMSNEVKLKQELQIIAEKLADIEAEMEEYK